MLPAGADVEEAQVVKIELEETPLPGCVVVRQRVVADARGHFREIYRSDEFARAGLPSDFAQVNESRSVRGVVRGLHFQWRPPMGKLMRVTRGTAFLVAVDLRRGSPTLGQWSGLEVDEAEPIQVWAPAGFARGFCVLSRSADVQYLCTATYAPDGESGLRWDDPEIGIDWPVDDPILSPKDASAGSLADWLARPESDAFRID